MCGFAALFEHDRAFPDALLQDIGQDLLHRGPDSGGAHAEPGAAIVFRRLSIIDPVERSDQPFPDSSGRFLVAFNGEIYNYKELRRRLSADGVALRTGSDTEVIAEGYARWGEQIVEMLEGMFAFAIYDRRDRNVLVARDPLGIKPLYLTRSGGFFAVASEARPLLRAIGRTEVDPNALADLLLFRFAGGRASNFKNVELLPGGCLARFRLRDCHYSETRFANILDTIKPDESMTQAQADELIEHALRRSIVDHLQSDVGYSLQFSGGVDSGLLLALTAQSTDTPPETYSIFLKGSQFDESRFRAPIIERYRPIHHEVELDGRDFADALPKAVFHMEGPSPHLGCVMLMLLCKEIAKKHKVVLTGEGADEFFGGYERYGRWRKYRNYARFARLAPGFSWALLGRYRYLRRFGEFEPAAITSVFIDIDALRSSFPNTAFSDRRRASVAASFDDFRNKLLTVDQTAYLGSLLMRQDKMAMAAGVEARVPFAHFPLAKELNRIPLRLRVPGGETKPLLKKLARKFLPPDTVDRRKNGLSLPLNDWLRDAAGLGRYLELLTEPSSRIAAIGNARRISGLVEAFRADANNRSYALLAHLINVELWLRSLDVAAAAPRPHQAVA